MTKFLKCCRTGNILGAKEIVSKTHNICENNLGEGFLLGCSNGHLQIVKWIYDFFLNQHQLDYNWF